ncbi:Uma2 family endonuclease [Actinomadura flavalba]|uniref:Uma2 family endonuclease n=1 Tax=Actinomadura flavalba TaxID=1120938 RepID=UPI00037152D5|nr:Uma2 family endonuclease [Actinomadura flavalba]
MTVMAHGQPHTHEEQDVLLDGFLALDTPEGFRAELIDGEIVVSPPPLGDHEDYLSTIFRQIYRHSSAEMDGSGNKGLSLRGADGKPYRVIPDGVFAPRQLRLFLGAEAWMPSRGVELVVEVTSSHAQHDRDKKRRAYAAGAIPLYLLVDRDERFTVLFSSPEGGDYTRIAREPFGKQMDLPDPFGFALDTSEFD